MSVYFPTSNVTIGGSLTATAANHNSIISVSNGTSATWSNNTNTKISAKGQLHLDGEDADVVINGDSLKDILDSITNRLAILQPKPELLAKYENLREAYNHYKTLENLLYEDLTRE